MVHETCIDGEPGLPPRIGSSKGRTDDSPHHEDAILPRIGIRSVLSLVARGGWPVFRFTMPPWSIEDEQLFTDFV